MTLQIMAEVRGPTETHDFMSIYQVPVWMISISRHLSRNRYVPVFQRPEWTETSISAAAGRTRGMTW
jgi:hypothetical protein